MATAKLFTWRILTIRSSRPKSVRSSSGRPPMPGIDWPPPTQRLSSFGQEHNCASSNDVASRGTHNETALDARPPHFLSLAQRAFFVCKIKRASHDYVRLAAHLPFLVPYRKILEEILSGPRSSCRSLHQAHPSRHLPFLRGSHGCREQ